MKATQSGPLPRNIVEHVAKAIFETKYPDCLWENMHPNRNVRKCRVKEAEAATLAYEANK